MEEKLDANDGDAEVEPGWSVGVGQNANRFAGLRRSRQTICGSELHGGSDYWRRRPGLVYLLVRLRGKLGMRAGFGIPWGGAMGGIRFAAVVLTNRLLFRGRAGRTRTPYRHHCQYERDRETQNPSHLLSGYHIHKLLHSDQIWSI